MSASYRWIGIGIILLINTCIFQYLIDDGKFVSSVCGLLAVIVFLFPMVNTIITDIKQRETKMHELAVLAVAASCLQGDFTTSAWVALFMVCSMMIENRTARGASVSLESLATLAPGICQRIRTDGSEEEVDGQELQEGDILRIRPGDNILADGTILKGRSSVNESSITGESLPVDKDVDDSVFAGTVNLTGVLDIAVLKAGENTTIGKVKELILKAQSSRHPFARFMDEYIKYYTPLVLTVAGIVLFFNRYQADGLDKTVAVLVAACPIALILATPAAVIAALSAAARQGILCKDINDMEALSMINAIMFDKTGTLTTGVLEVARLAPVEGITSEKLLQAASIAELGSNHPIAKAIRLLAKRVNISVERPEEFHEEPGRGVQVMYQKNKFLAGNLQWMVENGIRTENFGSTKDAQESGMSLLFLVENNQPLGWIGLQDTLRENACDVIEELQSNQVNFTAIVSGDRQEVVTEISGKVGIKHAKGECSPETKVSLVEEIKQKGYNVAFVGDGVNDAPALVSSHIGIAMGAAGSNIAMESATIALMNSDLRRIPFLFVLSRRMRKTIMQNFFAGGILVGVGIGLSATGNISPILAAGMQVFGVIAVAMNSARLIRVGEELDHKSCK